MFKKHPTLARFAVAILLFAFSLIISGIIETPSLKKYFPFTSALLIGIATWLLFRWEGKSLSELGLTARFRQLSFLPLGLLIGALAFLAAKVARAIYAGEAIAFSASIDYSAVLYGLYIILPTVAVEEFLFRGYLFKKTIAVSNAVIANIIFSVLFMLVHVLDSHVLSNLPLMIMLIVSIPVGHLWFATGLLRSKTIYFPIGLHLGNNWASRHLITNSDSGQSILYTINEATFDTWPFFIGFLLLFNGVFLAITYVIWKWPIIKSYRGS